MARRALLLVLALRLGGCHTGHPPPGFTRVLLHAGSIVGHPGATALAIRGERIAAIGDDALLAGCGPGCARQDVQGAVLSPGFHDAHVHLTIAAEQAQDLVLSGSDLPSLRAAIRAFAAAHPERPWIVGHGVDLAGFAVLPRKQDLDDLDPRPIVIRDATLHNVWVNGAALAAVGVDSPGVLFDFAARKVLDRLPPPADLSTELLAAETRSVAAGYTSIQGGPVSVEELEAYRELDRRGLLRQRVFLWAPLGGDDFEGWLARARSLPESGHVHLVAFKGFVDGTLALRTAALLAPYSDDPSTRGALVYPQARLAALVRRANQAGFPVALHAIGDRAVRAALDAFESSPHPGNRIEHLDVVDPADLPRFARLGVVAPVQPTFLFYRSAATASFIARVGPERAGHTFPWGELVRAGATLVFGTDYPVGGLGENPFRGLYCAITRRFADGTPWHAEQAVPPDVALAAYTATPAAIIGWGDRLGRLEPGQLADVVVLAHDPRDLRQRNKVLAVVIGGVPVATPAASGDFASH